jgi:hypothetical protein
MPLLKVSIDDLLFILGIITEMEKQKASDLFKAIEDITPSKINECKKDMRNLNKIKKKLVKESKKTSAWEHVKIFLKMN